MKNLIICLAIAMQVADIAADGSITNAVLDIKFDTEPSWMIEIAHDGVVSMTNPDELSGDELAIEVFNILLRRFGDTESVVKTLAAEGEICKVFGHQWPSIWFEDEGKKCKICGAREVTKTVTEIIPAKGNK